MLVWLKMPAYAGRQGFFGCLFFSIQKGRGKIYILLF